MARALSFLAADLGAARLPALCRRTGQPVPETKGEIVRRALLRRSFDIVEYDPRPGPAVEDAYERLVRVVGR